MRYRDGPFTPVPMWPLIQAGTGRDLRVDLFRGLALWVILVDHTPNNLFSWRTPLRLALADGAEIFVLLAGYAAGLVYGRVMDRQGWGAAALAALRRAGVIYLAHIFLVVLFAAEVGTFGTPDHLLEFEMVFLAERTFDALREALLLRYQPVYCHILPLYVVLLAVLAAALPLLRRPALLLGLALGVWAAAWTLRLDLPRWPEGGWFFNPLSWQALFLVGATLGYRPPGLPARSVPFRWWLAAAAVAYLVASKGVFILRGAVERGWVGLPARMADALMGLQPLGFADKTFQNPLRILSILALAYLAGHAIHAGAAWLRGRAAAPLVLMGQNGLPVFCATVVLSFLARLALEHLGGGWAAQAAVNVAGVALLVAVAAVACRLKPGRDAPRGTAAQAHATAPDLDPDLGRAGQAEPRGRPAVLGPGQG